MKKPSSFGTSLMANRCNFMAMKAMYFQWRFHKIKNILLQVVVNDLEEEIVQSGFGVRSVGRCKHY